MSPDQSEDLNCGVLSHDDVCGSVMKELSCSMKRTSHMKLVICYIIKSRERRNQIR